MLPPFIEVQYNPSTVISFRSTDLRQRTSFHFQWMRFRIKHELILALVIHLPRPICCLDKICVLHYLRKQEALLHIRESITTSNIDVVYLTVSRADTCGSVDRLEGCPGPVLICCVACHTVSVIDGFQNFWSKVVRCVCDPEAGFVVE